VILGLMLVGGLCALLALNTASAAQELRLRGITDDNAVTSDSEQQLLRDIAAKGAPAALASAAAQFGLVPNPNPAFLRINRDGSVSVLGSPMPATVPPPPPQPAPSKTATSSVSKSAKPSTSATPSKSATKPNPVVTVTVTRPAAPVKPTTSSTPRPSTTGTTHGGH
jgi:hypothetical protein